MFSQNMYNCQQNVLVINMHDTSAYFVNYWLRHFPINAFSDKVGLDVYLL